MNFKDEKEKEEALPGWRMLSLFAKQGTPSKGVVGEKRVDLFLVLLELLNLKPTRVSMEVSNWLVSGFFAYVRNLQPTYIGIMINLLSTMDIPVNILLARYCLNH